MAKRIAAQFRGMKLWKDNRGQDILEYALFVAAIGTLYAAFTPSVAANVTAILSKIASTMVVAASTS